MYRQSSASISPDSVGAIPPPHGSSSSLAQSLSPLARGPAHPDAASNASTALLAPPFCLLSLLDAAW
jgi:hypothetical protein